MTPDVPAAASFLAAHARQLDRRRFALLTGDGDVDGVLAALDGYRNPDGGYGWGLEPDLRSPESQPTAGMHAFEVLAEAGPGPVATPRALALCDWMHERTLPDGGLPFTLPITDPTGCAPWWLAADHTTSSLQMTTQVAAKAHVVARREPGVASHPWLATATRWCLDAIGAVDAPPQAHGLLFGLELLDAVHDVEPEAPALLDRLAAFVPADGVVRVAEGVEGESFRPLDLAPVAGRPVRRLFGEDAIAADRARLLGEQQPDGGWVVDFPSSSPVAALEWRGYATVAAVQVLGRGL